MKVLASQLRGWCARPTRSAFDRPTTYATPLTHADLAVHPRPRVSPLNELGFRISRELASEAAAIAVALQRFAGTAGGKSIDDAVIAAMPARRAASKRHAIRQRLARVSR